MQDRLNPPRLSVLIRTVGRATLAEALQSVLAQSMQDFAIKVVVAVAAPLDGAMAGLDDPRVEVIHDGSALPRSAAANRALNAAVGEFALFLDDDDLLLPDHLQRLVRALEGSADAVAAHAGVRCERSDTHPAQVLQVFDGDVSWAKMQLENRLPIHAVLFRRAAVQRQPPARFNEQLEQFEDWDFWLQLMARGSFIRVPGVSAVYRLDVQRGSGHSDRSNAARRAALERFAAVQLRRWSAADGADLVEQRAELVARQHQIDQELDQARRSINELQSIRVGLGAQLQQANRDRLELESARLALSQALNQSLTESEQLQQQLSDHRDELGRLQSARTELLSQMLAQGHAIDALRADMLAQAALHGQAMDALRASTSWRLTRPLRWAGDLWRALREGRLQRLPRNLLLALQSQQRRHGWAGMVTRLPAHLRRWRQHWRSLTVPVAAQVQPFGNAPPRPLRQARESGSATAPDRHGGPAPSAGLGAPIRLHPEIEGSSECLEHSVSVVIPTLNGGLEFEQLLRKLRQQRGLREIEIVVVDSGSSDATVAVARAAGAQVIQISQAEFSHSHARNLGAQASSGDYLVFMVQDAYPIGQLWLYGLLRWLRDHREQGVVAASCAEYCRSDSDLMYDSMVNTHYRFLGCLEADRIGQHAGDDHMALRSMGQLSDVACMIGRGLFLQHRYRGDYAEDLDLGMRLIQLGHRVAMLASVKVIHSHNRSAYYYLKRSFVDVIFLVSLFKDFGFARCASVAGLITGVQRTAARTSNWLQALQALAPIHGLDVLAPRRFSALPADRVALGDAALDGFIADLVAQRGDFAVATATELANEARQFDDAFLARVDHLHQFARTVYGPVDERLQSELAGAVRKTLAATLGAALAYVWLDRRDRPSTDLERQWIDRIFTTLKAGV